MRVVQEKHSLHSDHASEEKTMRHWVGAEGCGRVIDVPTQKKPGPQDERKRGQDGEREDQ